jgi:D-alanine-D-alanine ligase
VKETAQLNGAIEKAFAEGSEVIVESFVKGTEVTCGCYKTASKETVFPVTEVVTENEFFDYNAKYNGQVREITPARISQEIRDFIQKQTLEVYDLIGARGIIRIDYIIPEDNRPVLLEVNTNPGMASTSFIPQQIKAAGLDIKEIMTDIIENVW